jgi:hypothetical protein
MLPRLAAFALVAVLTCTGAPISAAESAVTTTQQVNPTLAPIRTSVGETITATQSPAKPTKTTKRKRRRHHSWFWHLVPGGGGPLSWLLLVPYLIIGIGLAAVLIVVRRRRRRYSR